LAWQPFAELFSQAAVVPERVLFGLTETGPDFLANFRFSQITEDSARIVNLVCQRNTKDVFVRRS
jgi:hypothetical protein